MTTNIRSLKLDEEDVDAISFSMDADAGEETCWNFSIMKLSDKQDFWHNELGYKYQVVLYKGDRAEVFEAIIGDLKYYINNLIGIKQEGMILKKCGKSDEIMEKLFRKKYMNELTHGLVQIASQKQKELETI